MKTKNKIFVMKCDKCGKKHKFILEPCSSCGGRSGELIPTPISEKVESDCYNGGDCCSGCDAYKEHTSIYF